MAAANRMMCPKCGVEMNHHGDKLIYANDSHSAPAVDPGLGGFIEEFHTCPRCGGSASRHP